MLIFLTTLLGTLSSMFRSRAALELENLSIHVEIGMTQSGKTSVAALQPHRSIQFAVKRHDLQMAEMVLKKL